MYKFILILSCLTCFYALSQERSDFKPGLLWHYTGIRPAKKGMARKYDRLVFDITYNDWMGDRKPFHNLAASIGLNTNFLIDIPLAKHSRVAIGTGLSHSVFRVRHHYSFSVHQPEAFTAYNDPTNALTGPIERSVFGGSVVSVPLELRLRGAGWKHIKFHIGAKVGYQTKLFSRTVIKTPTKMDVHTIYDFPDENRYIYSTHFRIGIRNWALYGSYNLNTLFNQKASSKLNMFQMGLSISLF